MTNTESSDTTPEALAVPSGLPVGDWGETHATEIGRNLTALREARQPRASYREMERWVWGVIGPEYAATSETIRNYHRAEVAKVDLPTLALICRFYGVEMEVVAPSLAREIRALRAVLTSTNGDTRLVPLVVSDWSLVA